MRTIEFTILILGFLWIVQDCFDGFTSYQHMRWIHTSQNLPPGEMIKREVGIQTGRELALDLKDRHRLILLPAGLMLFGGAILGSRKTNKIAEQGVAPNRSLPPTLKSTSSVRGSED